MDESAEGSCYMILGREVLAPLVIDIKFSGYVINCGVGPYEGFLAPMVM